MLQNLYTFEQVCDLIKNATVYARAVEIQQEEGPGIIAFSVIHDNGEFFAIALDGQGLADKQPDCIMNARGPTTSKEEACGWVDEIVAETAKNISKNFKARVLEVNDQGHFVAAKLH